MSQTLSEILSSKIPGIRANGINKTLTGLSASTSNDNIIAGLPSGHGIEIGDIIELAPSANVQFINYRIYGRRVIEIQNDSFNYIQETDVVPVGLNGTYDLEIRIDGGSPTNVSFNIVGGTDTWADVIVAINAGLSTAGLAATAFFNSPSTLWPGGVSNAQAGILIRSNTLGSGSSVNNISPGTSNDFYSGLSTINYSYSVNSTDASGVNFDLAISAGFTFIASTYSVSGPIYNGTFTVIFPAAPGIAVIQPLTPSLFTNGYTTQDSSNLSALTANHSMVVGSISGTVSVSNTNDVTYVGTPVTIATISTIDVIKKHYINNGNIGIGTQNPQYPLDILKDMYYKGNRFKKCNFTATANPTSSDDSSLGYEVDSLWAYGGDLFICSDASIGNATWESLKSISISQQLSGFTPFKLLWVTALGTLGENNVSYHSVGSVGLVTDKININESQSPSGSPARLWIEDGSIGLKKSVEGNVGNDLASAGLKNFGAITNSGTVTGIVPNDGVIEYTPFNKFVFIKNESSGDIIFKHQDSASSPQNRIITPDGNDFILPPDNIAIFFYDSVSSRWFITGNPAFTLNDTDGLLEGTTNLYFSEQRVRDTVLTGYSQSAGSLQATDTVLQAFNKLGSVKSGLISKQISTGTINKGDVVRVIANNVEKYSRAGKLSINREGGQSAFFNITEGAIGSFRANWSRRSNSTSSNANVVDFAPSTYPNISPLHTWGCEILPGKYLIVTNDTLRLININTATEITSQTITGASHPISISYLREGAAIVIYNFPGGSECRARIVTTDGSTLTLNTAFAVGSGVNLTPESSCVIDSNFVLVLARNVGYEIYAIKINSDGITIDSSTSLDTIGTSTSGIVDIAKFSDSVFAVTYRNGDTKALRTYTLNKSTPSSTVVNSYTLTSVDQLADAYILHLEKNMFLVACSYFNSPNTTINLFLIKVDSAGNVEFSPKILSETVNFSTKAEPVRISNKTIYVNGYGLIHYDYDKFIINDGEWYPNNLFIAENTETSPNNILLRHFGNLTDMPSNTYKAGLKYTVSDSGALVPITGNIEMDYPKLALAVSDTELLVYSK